MTADPSIHPSAIVEEGAALAAGVRVGPYSVIYSGARIGAGTSIGPHCTVYGEAALGSDNVLYPGVTLGGPPQSIGFDLAVQSRVEIGDRNEFRESVTVHRGEREGGVTRIGSGGFFMVSSHVGHDCQVGDGVIIANNSVLGGHVHVGDHVNVSAGVMVHQFVRVGRLAMLQGKAGISQDLTPFTMAVETNRIAGLNSVGLRRAGVSPVSRVALRRAYRTLFLEHRRLAEALDLLGDAPEDPCVAEMVHFIRSSERGVLRRQRTERAAAEA